MKKCAIIVLLATALAGCASEDEPEIRSEVSQLTITPNRLDAAGVLTADEHQDFAFQRPEGDGYIRVKLQLIGDLGLYSTDGSPVPLDQSDCVDETASESKGCFYVTADGIVYVDLFGFAPVSEYSLSIVFEGIGTTP